MQAAGVGIPTAGPKAKAAAAKLLSKTQPNAFEESDADPDADESEEAEPEPEPEPEAESGRPIQDSDSEDPEDPEDPVSVPPPSVAAAPGPAKKPAGPPSKTQHEKTLDRLLPSNVPLTWFVDLEQPETLHNMVSYVKPFVQKLTMYATDRRRYVTDRHGNQVVTGFRGIAIDAVDDLKVCMTIARLSARVCLDYRPGDDMDAVPGEDDANEAVVTVDTKTLLSTLKDARANETMVMFMDTESSKLSIAVTDSSGETSSQTLVTMESPDEHSVMDTMTYKYELSVPLNPVKSFVRRALDLKGTVLAISLYTVTQDVRVLCLSCKGQDADIFRVLPLGNVKDLGDTAEEEGGDGAEEDGSEVENATSSEKVASLKGEFRSTLMVHTDDRVKIPVRPSDLDPRNCLYSGAFALKYLNNMISPLSGTSQLSLFLPEDGDAGSPLILRFDLGKNDSYVAYCLAGRVVDEDE